MQTQNQDLKSILQLINQVTIQQTHKGPSKFEWYPIQIGSQDHIPYNVIQIKDFHYSDNIGFIWYKNLNIPSVEVVLDRSYYDKHSQNYSISAKMFGIRQKVDDKQLIQIQLEGKNELSLQFGECAFNGLKFKDTSSIYKGCKFFLIILLCMHKIGENNTQSNDQELLGTAMISPPIHILSRKKAHKERQSHNSLFDPFPVEKIEKKYNQILNQKPSNIPIENNIEGLYYYFTNPRIRCKIFHPLFLLLRFSNAINLYYNQSLVQEDQNSKAFVEKLQEAVYYCLSRPEELSLPDKLFFLSLNTEQESANLSMIEKIAKYLRVIEGQVVSFSSYNLCRLPRHFKKIIFNKNLLQQYTDSYQKINYLKFSTQSQKPTLQQMTESPLFKNDNYSKMSQSQSQSDQLCNPVTIRSVHSSVIVLSDITESEKKKRIRVKARYLTEQSQNEIDQFQMQQQKIITYFSQPQKHQYYNPEFSLKFEESHFAQKYHSSHNQHSSHNSHNSHNQHNQHIQLTQQTQQPLNITYLPTCSFYYQRQ